MATPRFPSLSPPLFLPLLRFLGCIFFHQHYYPPVTRNHPSFAVAKFLPLLLPFTALPPCTPSTDVLFYFIIRPDLGELGCCLGVYTERPLFFPCLSLSFSSSPRPPRFSANGETGISASNTRVLCRCSSGSCSLLPLPPRPPPPSPTHPTVPPPALRSSFTISLSRFWYVDLSSSRGSLSFVVLSFVLPPRCPILPVTERIKFMHG